MSNDESYYRGTPGYLLDPKECIERAMLIAETFGQCAGERQKAWVIDQMVRILYKGDYRREFLHSQRYTTVGQDARKWDPGTRPDLEKGDFPHYNIYVLPQDPCACATCAERGLSESGLKKNE